MFCEHCNKQMNTIYGSGRFCDKKCARSFSTKKKRQEINKKVSSKMTGRKLSDDHKKKIVHYKQRLEKCCLNCGEKMQQLPSDIRKFCTKMCWVTYTEKNKESYVLYRQRCEFDFNITDYTDKFDLQLVEQYGWYSPSNKGNNLNGVSKDHMFSVKSGFESNISPEIIKHPANCKIMLHKENQKKHKNSSISLDTLLNRIKDW